MRENIKFGRVGRSNNLEGGREILSLSRAREILGKENFFGIEEIQDILRVKHYGKLLEMPFNEVEIEFARRNNMYLIYRPPMVWRHNKLVNLTIENMVKFSDRPLLKNESIDAYRDDRFYRLEKPRTGWSLVSRQFNLTTLDQDFFGQMLTSISILSERTRGFRIYRHLKKEVDDYMEKYPDIYQEYQKDTIGASDKLLNIKLLKSLYRTAPEVVFDFLVTNDFPGMTENYKLSQPAKIQLASDSQYVEDDIHCWTSTMHEDMFVLIERRFDPIKKQSVLRIDHSYLDFFDNDMGMITAIN